MTSSNRTMAEHDQRVARDTIVWNFTRWVAIIAALALLTWIFA